MDSRLEQDMGSLRIRTQGDSILRGGGGGGGFQPQSQQQPGMHSAGGGAYQPHPPVPSTLTPNAEALERSSVMRMLIEAQYQEKMRAVKEKQARRVLLEKQIEAANLAPTEAEAERVNFAEEEGMFHRLRRQRLQASDFQTISLIGEGGYGEVRLVRYRATGEIFALKVLEKSKMKEKKQLAHVRAERDLLATADNPWVVKLHLSFQDELHLYLAMEYVPGGDAMALLMMVKTFTVDQTRFYIAETVLALASIHALNYIHRDVKPDNLLFDATGHIKVSDFGLAKPINPNDRDDDVDVTEEDDEGAPTAQSSSRRRKVFSTVGTPDYIAPEVLMKSGYGVSADWWSVGVITYEMLYGFTPFCAGDDALMTARMILDHKRSLVFPPEAQAHPIAVDFIRRLLCDASERLDLAGIQTHPFFEGIDWVNIRSSPAPFVPALEGPTDTSYFETFAFPGSIRGQPRAPASRPSPEDLAFVGYTFKRFDVVKQAQGKRKVRGAIPNFDNPAAS